MITVLEKKFPEVSAFSEELQNVPVAAKVRWEPAEHTQGTEPHVESTIRVKYTKKHEEVLEYYNVEQSTEKFLLRF